MNNTTLRTYMDTVDVNIDKTVSTIIEFFTKSETKIDKRTLQSLVTLVRTTMKDSSVNGWEVISKTFPPPTTTKSRGRKK